MLLGLVAGGGLRQEGCVEGVHNGVCFMCSFNLNPTEMSAIVYNIAITAHPH